MRIALFHLLALCFAQGNSQGIFGNLINGADELVHGASNIVGGAANDVIQGLNGIHKNPICQCDIGIDYMKSQDEFYGKLYKQVAAHSDNHFVFSPYTIWLSLAALAEGADEADQLKLFMSLHLPHELCLRKKYYETALNVEIPGTGVSLRRKRQLVLDDRIRTNPSWENLMKSVGLLDFAFAPIASHPAIAAPQLQRFIGAHSPFALSGNSILLDSLDYQGLWTTAFARAKVYREPFYNDIGQQIGMVNMMRMKKRVRLAHIPFMNAKVLELPVGVNGRYTMLLTIGDGKHLVDNSIFMSSVLHIFSLLHMSLVPIEIAVPEFAMTSQFNARPVLEEIGFASIFKNPAATSFVSQPPALPGGLIQRVTVRVGNKGINPPPVEDSGLFNIANNVATGLASAVGHQFIANRPFMFGLFDTSTNTCLFAGAYSRPGNR